MNETKKSLGQIAYEAWPSAEDFPWRTSTCQTWWEHIASAVADVVRKEWYKERDVLRERCATLESDLLTVKSKLRDADKMFDGVVAAQKTIAKERDEAWAECERLRKELAALTAPPPDGKEPGQRAFEAWVGEVGDVSWPNNVCYPKAWAHVERALEAPLRAEIVALKAENERLIGVIAGAKTEEVSHEMEKQEHTIRQRTCCGNCAHWKRHGDDDVGVCSTHKADMYETVWCGSWTPAPTESLKHESAEWPTPQIRWIKGEFIEGKYRLQQLWRKGCAEEWRDVEEV